MSERWNAHYAMVQGLIDAQKAQRAQKAAAAMAAQPAPAPPAPAPEPFGVPDWWQGGANGGMEATGKPGDLSGLMGGMGGFGPLAGGLLGGLAGTALAGPFGGALGAWGGRALAGLLGGPTAPQPMAQPTEPGIGSLGGESFGGSAGAGTFGGGLGDMGAAGMGLGVGDLGAMSGNDMMGWQHGGYTGAGRDGVVQPHKPAGIVHEGELVIPAHMVRMMGMLRR